MLIDCEIVDQFEQSNQNKSEHNLPIVYVVHKKVNCFCGVRKFVIFMVRNLPA